MIEILFPNLADFKLWNKLVVSGIPFGPEVHWCKSALALGSGLLQSKRGLQSATSTWGESNRRQFYVYIYGLNLKSCTTYLIQFIPRIMLLLILCCGLLWLGNDRIYCPFQLTIKSLIWDAPYPKTWMILISSCRCLCSIHWSQVLSREWRCSWSSADRRCSNYMWMINGFIAC